MSTEYPSLGYEVVNGATSIWERWDSYKKGEGFMHNAAMNSFSHYAFGAVNEWMFENMIGIKAIQNGFKKVRIQPEIPAHHIKEVKGEYRSIVGSISSSWHKKGNEITQVVEIPVNVMAEIILPYTAKAVSINQELLNKSPLVLSQVKGEKGNVIELGSGKYLIHYKH